MRSVLTLVALGFIALAVPAAATTVGGVGYDLQVPGQDVALDSGALASDAPVGVKAGATVEDTQLAGTTPACTVDAESPSAPTCTLGGQHLEVGSAPSVTYDVDVALPLFESAAGPEREPTLREMVAYGGSYELTVPQLALAAAAAGASAGLLYALWRALKTGGLLALVPLATHLKPSELLNDAHRKAIYDLIQSEPGVSTKDIADRLDLAWGTVTHHLLKLEKARFVVSQKFGKYRRYFVNGSGIEAKEQVAVLKVARTGDVVEFVRAHPGASQKDVSAGMGVSSSTVLWHVKRLMRVGVIDKVRDGKSVRYFVKDGPAPATAVVVAPTLNA